MGTPRLSKVVIVVVVLALAAAAVRAEFQSGPTASGTSPDALLHEVRALRGDLKQLARVSVLAQLQVGRLQLQEQRVSSLAARLTQTRQRIEDIERERLTETERLARFQEALRDGTIPSLEVQKALQLELPHWKQRLTRLEEEERQLRLQESELFNEVSSEQARWVDFNSRLDDLERQIAALTR